MPRADRLAAWATVLIALAAMTLVARADDHCLTVGTGEIRDAPFHLTFDSWVEEENGRYVFGRCVGTLNGQSVRINWPLAQLSGEARPNFPQLVRMRFSIPTATEQLAEMKYGVNRPPERRKEISVLLNSAELTDIPEVSATTDNLKQAMLAGETLERSQLFISTDAHVAFDQDEVPLELTVNFESRLTPESIVAYTLDFSVTGDVPASASMRPQSDYMRYVLATSLDRELLPLSEGKGQYRFAPPEELSAQMSKAVLTQRVDVMDVVRDGEVLASFPYAIHAPMGAIVSR